MTNYTIHALLYVEVEVQNWSDISFFPTYLQLNILYKYSSLVIVSCYLVPFVLLAS